MAGQPEATAPLMPEFRNLFAYRLNGKFPILVRAKEWQEISNQFDTLAADLPLDNNRSMDVWVSEGLLLLPAGAFFWLDEFLEEFSADIQAHGSLPQVIGGISSSEQQAIFEGLENFKVSGKESLWASKPPGEARVHKLKVRANTLDPVIELAIVGSIDPESTHAVWNEMVRLAESKDKPAPLLGFVDGEGLKYQGNDGPAFLTKKNLNDRLKRRRAKAC